VVPWTYIALRGLAASYAAPVCAPLVLGIVFSVAGLFFWRAFLSKDRLLVLLVPASLLLLPYALTAVGRVQLGIGSAASSRYQYLAAAALGLILAWLAGGVFEIAQSRYSNALVPLSLVVLLTLPLDALAGYVYLGRSPMLEWGRSARRFVSLAVYRRNWANAPAGTVCVHPELYLPAAMYPHPFFDLSRALELYGGTGSSGAPCPVGVASILGDLENTRMNLLNGGARRIEPGNWRGAGDYSFETNCANGTHPYTFAASVRLLSGNPGACLRILFKNAHGDILDTFPSQAIAPGDFSTMVVSAYAPPDTATVTVDFSGSSPSAQSSVISVRDALLVEHPVYLSTPR
jgi:hypothetical protein